RILADARAPGHARPSTGASDEILRASAGQWCAWLQGPEFPLTGFEPKAIVSDQPKQDTGAGVGTTAEDDTDKTEQGELRRPDLRRPSEASSEASGVSGSPREESDKLAPAPNAVAPLVIHKGFHAKALQHRPVFTGTRPCFQGHYYYEVKICYNFARSPEDLYSALSTGQDVDDETKAKKGGAGSIGWSTPAFLGDHLLKGVGDDRFSWGYEGGNPGKPGLIKFCGKRFGPKLDHALPKWEERMVVGVACSITDSQAKMYWTLNGELFTTDEPDPVDLSVYSEPGLVPAISLHEGLEIQINLGPNFWYGKKTGSSLVTPWAGCEQPFKPVRALKAGEAGTFGATMPQRVRSGSVTSVDGGEDTVRPGPDGEGAATLQPSVHDMDLWKGPPEQAASGTGAAGAAVAASEWATGDSAGELRKWVEKHEAALKTGVHLNLSGFLQVETQRGAMAVIAKLLDILLERKAQIHSIDLSRNPQLGLDRESQDRVLRAVAKLMKDPKIPLTKVVLGQCKLQSDDALNTHSTGLGSVIGALDPTLPDGFRVNELDLSGNELGEAMRHVSDKKKEDEMFVQDLLLSVRTLSLQGNEMNYQDLRGLLPGLTGSAQVRDIRLGDNILDDTGAVELATELGYNRELRALDLRNTTMSPKGIFALTSCITPSHKLSHLNLSFNNVGKDGASAIAKLVSIYPRLTHLDVTSAEIPSEGLREIVATLITAPCQLETLKIGDNELNNETGEEVARFLNSGSASRKSLRSLDLGSRSSFTRGFEACDLLRGCRAALQSLVFRGQSLEVEDRCKFIFAGCKHCMDLASLDVGLIKIDRSEGSKLRVGKLFERPLTFLLTDGMAGNDPTKRVDAVKDYMVVSASRIELIEFLIKQRNEPPRKGEDGKRVRPFVDTRDAISAIHGIVRICNEDTDWPQELRDWRTKVVELMLGPTAKEGFCESRLVQLPVCTAVLAATSDEKVIHHASVREKVDAWQVRAKEDGKTVLQEAIEAECSEIACLVVKRNSAVKSEFLQGQDKQDVTQLYSSLCSTDGQQKFDREPDYIGINDPSDATLLVPLRAAASRGMWQVVHALRQAARCVDGYDQNVFGTKHRQRTVWHDLATPEWSAGGPKGQQGQQSVNAAEQINWAEDLITKDCSLLAKAYDDEGRLPLHWAAQNNHPQLTRILVDLYCPGYEYLLKKRDLRNFSPLELAVKHGNIQTVKALVAATEQHSSLTNLSITSSFKREGNPYLDDNEAGWGASKIARFLYWVFRNEPSRKEICWPCSAYHLVLLQMNVVMRGDHTDMNEGLDIDRKHKHKGIFGRVLSQQSSIQRRKRKRGRKAAPDETSKEIMHAIRRGDGVTYRRLFLIRYLLKKMTLWVVIMGMLFLVAQTVFVGGWLSNTRMSPALTQHATSWMFDWNFEKNVVESEVPWETEKFATTFYDLSTPEDVWTFINGTLFGFIFPGLGPGEVGSSSFLIGSPVIQMAPWVYGDCDTLLMKIPRVFEGLGSDSDTCIVDR
ncbi:unnamed protein product, partial [Prorocentrum cordatum]